MRDINFNFDLPRDGEVVRFNHRVEVNDDVVVSSSRLLDVIDEVEGTGVIPSDDEIRSRVIREAAS